MKRVCFLLENKWSAASLPDAEEAVRVYQRYGFDAAVQVVAGGERSIGAGDVAAAGSVASVGNDAGSGGATPWMSHDTLYIADSGRLLRELGSGGAAFCAYSHSGNSGEDLSAAEYVLMEPQWVDSDSLLKIWQRQRNVPWSILETERCIVREFIPEDLDAIYALYDETAKQFLEPPSADRRKEREILASYIGRVYRLWGYGNWAVILKKTGEVIGRMGFSFPAAPKSAAAEAAPGEGAAPENASVPESAPGVAPAGTGEAPVPAPDASFGYLLRRDMRGQGITREVGGAILAYGFTQLGFETIGADAAVSNTVSDKILRNFLFVPVAEAGKQRYYILHKTIWEKYADARG